MRANRLFRPLLICLAALALGLSPMLMPPQDSSARPFRVGKLPPKAQKFGCGACHQNPRGGGPRNAFGRDYARIALKAGDHYTKRLGVVDSDGDGFSNDREFDAGTHPAKPKSRP